MEFQLDFDFNIQTDVFNFRFERGNQDFATIKQELGHATVFMPQNFDFSLPLQQEWAKKILVDVLRQHGKIILRNRTVDIAQRYGFQLKRITVKNIISCWGSCSSLKNINLSLWLMLLPSELIDYVIKHELTHLQHLDHSPSFWVALDRMFDEPGTAKRLDKKLDALAKSKTIAWVRLFKQKIW